MGYGTIVAGGADGSYTIELDIGAASRDVLVAELDARLAELAAQIAERQAVVDAANAETDAARLATGVAIDALAVAMQTNPVGDHGALQADVDAKLRKVVELEGRAAVVRIPLDLLKGDRANLERKKASYAELVLSRTQQAWCVDLTEDASGGVATIEVPGEPQSVLIAPGGHAWTQAADGLLLSRALMTPEQAFFNAAILPGWQKWKPTYRKGTILSVNVAADVADVQLDAAVSTAQGLAVNQADVLASVPVEYMTCNAAVFEPGDRCVVQFEGQAWSSPKVVGFAEWPKACELVALALHSGGGLQPKVSCVVAMSPTGAVQKQWVSENDTHVAIGAFRLQGALCYERGQVAGPLSFRAVARQGGDLTADVAVQSLSFDGTEVYGVQGASSGHVQVLNVAGLTSARTLSVTGTELLQYVDAWDGLVVASGSSGGVWVLDGATGTVLHNYDIPGGNAAADVAIHRRLVCVLELASGGYNLVVRRRSDFLTVATEFLSDAVYEAVTTVGDYVFVQSRKHPSSPVPICKVFKVDPDGVSMTLTGTYEPFAQFLADHPLFDSSRAGAGH